MILFLKKYWLIGTGAIISLLVLVSTVLFKQNSRLRRNLETKDARIKHDKVVLKMQQETEVQLRSRRADLVNELKENKVSSELENPNEW